MYYICTTHVLKDSIEIMHPIGFDYQTNMCVRNCMFHILEPRYCMAMRMLKDPEDFVIWRFHELPFDYLDLGLSE